MTEKKWVPADRLRTFVADLFIAGGFSEHAAHRVADALIEADLSGRGSHGLLQADNYLGRLVAGAMSTIEKPTVISRSKGAIVLDAENMEGHLAAEESVMLGVEEAREQGVVAVALRRAQHTGVNGRYVRMAAERGCVALAVSNAKPVMPAPGGAQRLVGTNPLSVGIPATEGPIVMDMATSAGTIGRIREAKALGMALPEGWATDAEGNPTTDPATALAGMLLPVGGAKGFALSFVIDLLAGLLSGGAWGDKLGQLDNDNTKALVSAFVIIVVDVSHFRPLADFMAEADEAIARVRNARRAPGVDRLYTPGERSAETLAHSGGMVNLVPSVAAALAARARELAVSVPDFLES